ncbi:MAG: hypothetical protein RLZZ592_2192 [Pseudomonadota bacterium]|jgi:hypothetical protein
MNTPMNDTPKTIPSDAQAVADTVEWLEKAVIGLNLCPFAKAVHVKQQIRYQVSHATDAEGLLQELVSELELLAETSPEKIETTLLIHPQALTDFMDFNDFLEVADAVVEELQLDGILQVASFHPDYQFDETHVDDIENFSNRSPWPTLHLIREASIDAAVEAFPDAADIYERNIETLKKLGHAGWKKLFTP